MGGGASVSNEPYSLPLENTKETGFSAIYRNSKHIDQLYGTPDPKLKTMKDVYIQSCTKKFQNNDYIGQVYLKQGQNGEDQRSLKMVKYQQAYLMAQNLGSHVVEGKFEYPEKLHNMKLIGVFSKNRYEWIVADIACALYGLTIVPLYDTLGVQNLTYCLEHSEITSCFVTSGTIQALLKLKGHGKLKNLIVFGELSQSIQKDLKNHDFNVFYFSQMIKKPKKHIDHKGIKILPQSCLTFSYTSGTTGPPKGAMLSHQNFLGFLAAFEKHQIGGFKPNDSYLSFLPLPHVFERVIQAGIAYSGASATFFNGDVTKLKDDCAFLKPTIFIGVPRIFNRIVEAVQKKFEESSGIKKCLITGGVKSKNANFDQNGSYSSGFYDSVVFSKIRQGFGGKVRLMITGSAPIKADVFKFMKVIMCCPFYEGYGQTQNTAAAFITSRIDNVCGHVGGVVTDLEFKLSDIPEMHYTSEDKDQNNNLAPRGEVWLRGPAVFMGYYKDDEKTKEALTNDGWLKTGDVGTVLPYRNALKIIDRKKNIFKLQQGQYVASQKVQAIYSKSHLVVEAFLHGQSTQNFAVVIIAVNREQFLKLAKSLNIEKSHEQLCRDKAMKISVLKQINSVGRKEKLVGFQLAKNIYIEPENFQARQILTNTLKLQRFAAKKFYANEIKDMYKEGQLNLK